MGDPGEQVLVVPREAIVPGDGWLGLRPDGVAEALATIAREGRFVAREAAERDPSHKQVIPYLVLRDGERWFLMRRTRAGGDARLHDRWSIGVGGHLNPGDGDVPGGLRREWSEELVADFVPEFTPVGLLNDDTVPVGSVHIGIVYVADAGGRPVTIRETDKLEGTFVSSDEVAAVRDGMETWSRLVFDALTRTAGLWGDRPEDPLDPASGTCPPGGTD
jgi:predicted NUDIX family phosphoesterase